MPWMLSHPLPQTVPNSASLPLRVKTPLEIWGWLHQPLWQCCKELCVPSPPPVDLWPYWEGALCCNLHGCVKKTVLHKEGCMPFRIQTQNAQIGILFPGFFFIFFCLFFSFGARVHPFLQVGPTLACGLIRLGLPMARPKSCGPPNIPFHFQPPSQQRRLRGLFQRKGRIQHKLLQRIRPALK